MLIKTEPSSKRNTRISHGVLKINRVNVVRGTQAHIRVSGFFVCVTTDCSEEQMVLFVYILGFEWHV